MPGALAEWHVLHDGPGSPDQQMTGNLECRDLAKIGMRIRIELIGEQVINPRTTELARRQRNIVHDDELGPAIMRPLVAVWRRHLKCAVDDSCFRIDMQHRLTSGLCRTIIDSRTITEIPHGSTYFYNGRMHPRIFSDTPLAPDSKVVLTGTSATHVSKVLRLRQGDAITVFDSSGMEYAAHIDAMTRHEVSVTIGAGHAPPTESVLDVCLLQGICRGQRMDMLIQKTTELGIRSIHPIACERSVVRLDVARSKKKVDHWRQIAISACEQSGRVHVPDIAAPAEFEAALASLGDAPGHRLLLDPTADRGIDTTMNPEAGIALLIGPEGGLTPAEREVARAAGFQPIRLGPRILRTETAPLAALSILQYLFGDLG